MAVRGAAPSGGNAASATRERCCRRLRRCRRGGRRQHCPLRQRLGHVLGYVLGQGTRLRVHAARRLLLLDRLILPSLVQASIRSGAPGGGPLPTVFRTSWLGRGLGLGLAVVFPLLLPIQRVRNGPRAHATDSCTETGMRSAEGNRRTRALVLLTPRRTRVVVQHVLLPPRQPLRHAMQHSLEERMRRVRRLGRCSTRTGRAPVRHNLKRHLRGLQLRSVRGVC